MKIEELLSESEIVLDFEGEDKRQALQLLVRKFSASCPKVSQKSLLSALLKREALGSTGIGNGVAIPHARISAITASKGFLAVSRKGIEFNALDGKPVHILFLIAYPEKSVGEHLKALSNVAKLLRDKFIRDLILASDSPGQVLKVLVEEEARENTLSFSEAGN
ncbi:MAG TPA: PTS sugar transporter subunit IIA [Candidatus Omnitrophota bacterium]|nr:PTS sugar transporter subunit IIA [Candidatus Omnitrophota bacterium]